MSPNENVQPVPFFCRCGVRLGDDAPIMEAIQTGTLRCLQCRQVVTIRNGKVYWLNRHERRQNDRVNRQPLVAMTRQNLSTTPLEGTPESQS